MISSRRRPPEHSHPATPVASLERADGDASPGHLRLDRILPDYHYRGVVRVSVHASPDETYRALRTVTMADMRLAYTLGSLRYLPARLLGRQQPPDDILHRPFFEVTMPVLNEDPGRELVIGCIGKPHNLLDQQWVDLPDISAFTGFDAPGYEKFAMSVLILPHGEGGSTIVSDHRTLALDPSARRKFALYWYLMVGWGGTFMLRQLLGAVRQRAERLERDAPG